MNRSIGITNRRRSIFSVWSGWLTAGLVAIGVLASASFANAESRTLRLYNLHTKEKAEITFKRNGKYDPAGLQKANVFLRDWRRNEPTKMDPRLLDLVWEAYRASGSRDYIHVICGYRAPATNSMLRSRSKGVAEKSQHVLGKAMDFYIPDVKLKTLRNIGLKMQTGGVGYYPTSGSPFVHMDVGNVRHWPGISRQELAAVFPNGKTLHVPSDGKPLPGYETALASYQARKKSGTTALALASAPRSKSGGLLAALFGGGADEEEDNGSSEEAVAAPKTSVAKAAPKADDPAKPVAVASAKPQNAIQIVPPELANPAAVAPFETAQEEPEAIVAALPTRDIPLPVFAPRPKAEVGPVPFGIAEAPPAELQAEDAEDLAVAADVPVPTWRPDYQSAPQTVAEAAEAAGEDGPVLMAMAEAPVNAPRSVMIGVPLPEERPDAAYSVAGLPESGPIDETERDQIEDEIKVNNQRLALLATGATPKPVIIDASEPDPKLAVGSGAKTTKKTARARVGDTKPDARPLVVAAQPGAVRWARYDGDYVAETAGTPAPPVARNLVRAAPAEVYAVGFQHDGDVANADRFSGKAVTFMPVARFTTN